MFFLVALLLISQPPAVCGTAAECRDQALAAAAQADYEGFHDLAWRAVQKGKPNDPALMYLLARAQALSGRPGDALVMLQRLVDLGVTVDATTDDFRRVRALKGWPDLEARIAGRPASIGPDATSAAAEKAPAPREARGEAAAVPSTPTAETTDATEEALSFEIAPFDAVGLAYDAVSRRFIVGDRTAGRLVVIDEMSHHVTNLVSAASAGFFATITAFEIDARRGDLWVASASADGRESALHKLQLVSGRVLEEVRLPASEGRSALIDLAITADGTVLGVEEETGRLVRLRPGARVFEDACRLRLAGVRSLAVADDRLAYVSSDEGIAQVDLGSCATTPVQAARNMDVSRIDRLRWHNGALMLVQRLADNRSRIARVRLDGAGKSIARLQVLAVIPETDPRTSTISGTNLYYLVGASRPSIRRARLK